jgi:BASS family bile acid:Na+ symporter
MILVAACPGGNMSNFFTHTAKGNVALSISLTGLSTILAPIATPIIFSFYASLDEGTRLLMKDIELDFLRNAQKRFNFTLASVTYWYFSKS